MLFGCTTITQKLPSDYDKLEMIIASDKNQTSDTAIITVTFRNNTAQALYLLNYEIIIDYFPNILPPYSPWSIKMLFNSTVEKWSSNLWFTLVQWDMNKPKKEEYICIKSGNEFSVNFPIDFRILCSANDDIHPNSDFINNDYGIYSIRLGYEDRSHVIKNSINWKLESNTIKILYEK